MTLPGPALSLGGDSHSWGSSVPAPAHPPREAMSQSHCSLEMLPNNRFGHSRHAHGEVETTQHTENGSQQIPGGQAVCWRCFPSLSEQEQLVSTNQWQL